MPGALGMSTQRQAGASLVEVAVAVLVISAATVGLARAHLAARQMGFSALQRAEAVTAAESLVTIARSSSGAIASLVSLVEEAGTPPLLDCREVSCDSSQWLSWNTWHWSRRLAGREVSDGLEMPVAGLMQAVACTTAENGELTLSLRWQDGGYAGASVGGCAQSLPLGTEVLLLRARVGEKGS